MATKKKSTKKSPQKKGDKRELISNSVFLLCLILGAGAGFYLNNIIIGMIFGLGIGFLSKAIFEWKQ